MKRKNHSSLSSSQALMSAPTLAVRSVDKKALSQLLQWVVEGEQEKAEGVITQNKNLLRHAGTVTDLSGREFKQITAFQYALWALDWHMWTMIQKYLPKEAQAEQFAALESKGTAHGKNFSLKLLIDALQTYADNGEKVWLYDQRAIDHWCKVVGGEQKQLPAHVVNEYCRSDRAFARVFEPFWRPEWESRLPRTRDARIWDSTQLQYIPGSWFVPPSSQNVLGGNFAFNRWYYDRACWALLKCRGGTRYFYVGCAHEEGCASDLQALQSLWKRRTQQLEQLSYHLKQGLLLNEILTTAGRRIEHGCR